MLRCLLRSRAEKQTDDEWFDNVREGNLEDIKILYSRNGEDLNRQDSRGMTAIHYAIERNDTALTDWLISHGAKLNKLNKDRKSPLILATERGNSSLVEKLVRKGANLQVKCKKSSQIMQPVHIAVSKGDLDILHYLLEHGAEANVVGPNGKTALDIAQEHNQKEAERILLKYINTDSS